ncbi:hypothetical protein E2562_006953 [Oryza meyeriana var. granulata]|uniref:Uncharacterized protein n=1 Tax=Oryza meyeriana var. granulata TaxID=110450 RepID=A0A6G1EAC5_9ORYZ|nr:hypothetical protein E2562_006953 [Oryza meyeriana var. granulata]
MAKSRSPVVFKRSQVTERVGLVGQGGGGSAGYGLVGGGGKARHGRVTGTPSGMARVRLHDGRVSRPTADDNS